MDLAPVRLLKDVFESCCGEGTTSRMCMVHVIGIIH
jgi:hypothetical protein